MLGCGSTGKVYKLKSNGPKSKEYIGKFFTIREINHKTLIIREIEALWQVKGK